MDLHDFALTQLAPEEVAVHEEACKALWKLRF